MLRQNTHTHATFTGTARLLAELRAPDRLASGGGRAVPVSTRPGRTKCLGRARLAALLNLAAAAVYDKSIKIILLFISRKKNNNK